MAFRDNARAARCIVLLLPEKPRRMRAWRLFEIEEPYRHSMGTSGGICANRSLWGAF
jgi:hypothetical protein